MPSRSTIDLDDIIYTVDLYFVFTVLITFCYNFQMKNIDGELLYFSLPQIVSSTALMHRLGTTSIWFETLFLHNHDKLDRLVT